VFDFVIEWGSANARKPHEYVVDCFSCLSDIATAQLPVAIVFFCLRVLVAYHSRLGLLYIDFVLFCQ